MTGKQIEGVIKEYLSKPKVEYAIMINGDWGSGKTFFLKNSLNKILDEVKEVNDLTMKTAYVSLYGATSLSDISKEILLTYFEKKRKKKNNNKKRTGTASTVLDAVGNITAASVGPINIDLSNISKIIAKVNTKNWLICFDDLERCTLPINEILGFINQLIEHNQCKIIILANEKEIGKSTLNHNLEGKYQVVLNNRMLDIPRENDADKYMRDKTSMTQNQFEKLNVNDLHKLVESVFSEDTLYKSIKEKVIGFTVSFEPQMEDSFDSIIADMKLSNEFELYLSNNKEKILGYFKKMECYNLRTLINIIESLYKVFSEMQEKNYQSLNYYERIMDDFLKYIVQFTICYRNGEDVSKLHLTESIGYINLEKNSYADTLGFKFLEQYCTTLGFAQEEFTATVKTLEDEYEAVQAKKNHLGVALQQLESWWELEDADVQKNIKLIKEEIQQDKYPFQMYPRIIARLLDLKHYEFNFYDIDEIVALMNHNIDSSTDEVNISNISITFNGSLERQDEYNHYVSRLETNIEKRNQIVISTEIEECLNSEFWARSFHEYCRRHSLDFVNRHGFIDLVELNKLEEKLKNASPQEWDDIGDGFDKVYNYSNINEFFSDEVLKLEKLKNNISQMEVSGITRNLARKKFIASLDNILKKLR